VTKPTQSPKDKPKEIEDATVIKDTTKPSATAVDKKTDTPAKTGALWFFTSINLLILILICAAAYWYYTQILGSDTIKQADIAALKQDFKAQSRRVESDLSQLKQSAQSLENNIVSVKQAGSQNVLNAESQLTQKMTNVQNELIQKMTNVQEEQVQVNRDAAAINKRLDEMSSRRPSDWLLAEANYLVNMAGRKLYLENDVRTAITLLREADARLNDLNDPSLFPVRALISADVQALAQINAVSTNSIALALEAMLPNLSKLPLDTLQLPENTDLTDLSLSEDVRDWRLNLKKTWQSIVNDLISIDYVNQPLEPYLAQRQQWLIEQQLNFALTQAQSAALNEQVAFYRSAIQRGISLLVEHYQVDNTQVSQFLVALQELQNIDFSRQYPSSLSSQASLKAIIEKRIEGLYNNSKTPIDDTLSKQL